MNNRNKLKRDIYTFSFPVAMVTTYIARLKLKVTVKHCNENPHLCIPFLEIARPQSQFPYSCVYERFIYSQDRSKEK
jgi:hypothetical protein